MLASYDHSVERLAEMGAAVVDQTLSRRFRDYAESTMGCIVSAEAYALLGDIRRRR